MSKKKPTDSNKEEMYVVKSYDYYSDTHRFLCKTIPDVYLTTDLELAVRFSDEKDALKYMNNHKDILGEVYGTTLYRHAKGALPKEVKDNETKYFVVVYEEENGETLYRTREKKTPYLTSSDPFDARVYISEEDARKETTYSPRKDTVYAKEVPRDHLRELTLSLVVKGNPTTRLVYDPPQTPPIEDEARKGTSYVIGVSKVENMNPMLFVCGESVTIHLEDARLFPTFTLACEFYMDCKELAAMGYEYHSVLSLSEAKESYGVKPPVEEEKWVIGWYDSSKSDVNVHTDILGLVCSNGLKKGFTNGVIYNSLKEAQIESVDKNNKYSDACFIALKLSFLIKHYGSKPSVKEVLPVEEENEDTGQRYKVGDIIHWDSDRDDELECIATDGLNLAVFCIVSHSREGRTIERVLNFKESYSYTNDIRDDEETASQPIEQRMSYYDKNEDPDKSS